MKKYIFSGMMLLCSLTMVAQENTAAQAAQRSETFKTVKGQVIDAATQKPMVGVIVTAFGNDKYSAMTNEEGRYTLNVPNYVSSVQMRIDGYNYSQCAIVEGEANGKLYHESFTEVYKQQTNAIQSSEANRLPTPPKSASTHSLPSSWVPTYVRCRVAAMWVWATAFSSWVSIHSTAMHSP